MASSLTLISSFFLAVISTASAAEILVGGDVGRRQRNRTLHRFRYKNDSVAVVEKWEFYHCDTNKAYSFHKDGDTLITLYSTGDKYFISGDPDRCKQGVNMKVDVILPAWFFRPPGSPHSPTSPSPSRPQTDVTLIFINPKISYLKLSRNPHQLPLLSSPVPLCCCKSSVN
ncbi:hypothetical protein L1987_49653 [Smallanthus sonchifolius]|uniref:Uncharacterized protein n=1 Tax=Smallanthus sonchifolius TaxID=185202 RepID=A0ACB9FWB1_9ASTR|nr:hypothetical protein L1987_49653 [Smallanthus sonchifolius]